VEAQTLDSRVDELIPARMASYRHFVSDYAPHHANRRPTAYAERGDGAWVES
jgi:hypothetical protein